MTSEVKDIVIPSIAFFITFYMTFNLVELLIILLLNRLIYRNWTFFVDKVMYVKVFYGKRVRRLALTFMAVFVILIIQFTAIADIIIHSGIEIKVMAMVMFFAMLIIYVLTTRKVPILHLMKQVHTHLFIYISIIVYVLVISLVNQYYNEYQYFVNTTLVAPVTHNSAQYMENKKRNKLLQEFRSKIEQQLCDRVDYTNSDDDVVRSFIYIATHQDLKLTDKPISRSNPSAYLTGRLCKSKTANFLLNDYGQWYWVVEEKEATGA